MSERRAESDAQDTSRPSPAIQHGTELLVAFIEGEQARLKKLHHDELKAVESRVREASAVAEEKLANAHNEIRERQTKMDQLTVALRAATEAAQKTIQEHTALVREHEHLKASLQAVGLGYSDGAIHFDDVTAGIVDDFVTGARGQNKLLAGAQLATIDDALLSNPVGPAKFWLALAAVLEQGHKLAAPNAMQTKAPSHQ